ncbi:MAG: histone deacetylase family protein [Thiobacillaceae bacterium]
MGSLPTAFITHSACAGHDLGAWHPEQPGRIAAIDQALQDDPAFSALIRVEAPAAEQHALERVHPADYLDTLIKATPPAGINWLDPDTGLCPRSWDAALHAAGAGVKAVDDILAGAYQRAFCDIRPPGHHAESARAMGFCLLNNIALAARHALDQAGITRVVIVDFDVHHGNGTEQIFDGNERVLLLSSFQHPLFPYCGTTAHPGYLPMPLPAGTDSKGFRAAWQERGLPALDACAPDFVLISAGFDAHRDDPLAGLNLLEEDFAWLTGEVCRIADVHAGGRVIAMLEGGYDLPALGRSAAAHVKALMHA